MKVQHVALLSFGFSLLSGCATLRGGDRILLGAAGGAVLGATGGTVFSPNDPSRGMNALVFGGLGAVAGGLFGYLTDPRHSQSHSMPSRLEAERASPQAEGSQEIAVPESRALPNFLKERLKPVVIEEYVEIDQVTSDGVLHEPHKAYRIKQPAELISRPEPQASPSPTRKPEEQK